MRGWLSDAPRLRFVKQDVIRLWTADGSGSAAVAPDIHASKDGSTTSLVSAPNVDPWEPSKKLTFGELNVILEARRHWPDCQCRLRPKDVYKTILANWDRDKLGAPCGDVTIKRALKSIPAWNAWRTQDRGH